MLTQCSHCKKTYNISIAELKTCSTDLCCPNCEEMLGRLKIFHADFSFGSVENTQSQRLFWGIGFLASLLLLLSQVYFVARNKFSQNPQQRVWLEKICQSLPCSFPDYKNLDEFEIMHGDFQQVDNHYVFQTVLSNQADFSQSYPRIKLNLLDFSGKVFAERIFYPREYLGSEPVQLMPASETIEVNLNIATPTQKVGGYTFDLI